MTNRPTFAAALLLIATTSPVALASQAARAAACSEWQQCRQLALEAADRGDYETFHDLAWRAVQTGKRNDPALMYLLARAQALSGRPHDALVMLERLADMGVASDAATNEDFRRTRELPGWPGLAARVEQLNRPDASPAVSTAGRAVTPSTEPVRPDRATAPAPVPAPAPAAPPAAHAAAPTAGPGTAKTGSDPAASVPASAKTDTAQLAGRFSTPPFQLAGFAYDIVSSRFLFGDRGGRKLIVVGEGSDHAVDLVRAESAGFEQVAAIGIDEKRGDLWVASGADGAGILHRLQLVSGRPLKSYPVPSEYEPVDLIDLAVTPAGAVLALNRAASELIVLPAGDTTFGQRIPIKGDAATSVAAAADEHVAYVAHRDGISRIDMRRRTAARLRAPARVSLEGIERIRCFRNALVAVALDADGSRRIVRLDLDSAGSGVAQATTLESGLPPSGPASVTVSGSELIYVVADASGGPAAESFTAYRVRLR